MQQSTEKQYQPVLDTSDEEPVAKIARISDTEFERNDDTGDEIKSDVSR